MASLKNLFFVLSFFRAFVIRILPFVAALAFLGNHAAVVIRRNDPLQVLLEEFNPETQRAYHLTGPRAWTMGQVADELSRLLGRKVVYKHRSTEEQRAALLTDGLPPLIAELLVGLDQVFRDSVLSETTSTFEELTGKGPRTLPQWLAENIESFRNQPRR